MRVRRRLSAVQALVLLLAAIQLAGCGTAQRPTIDAAIHVEGHDVAVHVTAQHFDLRRGHFHLQLDGSPVVMTAGPDWIFHQIASGKHSLTASLALNDIQHTIMAQTKQQFEVP